MSFVSPTDERGGIRSVVGSMQLPMHGFGDKGSGDDASLRSGLSGETLTGEKGGGRRASLVKRLFHRKGGEKGGKEKEME